MNALLLLLFTLPLAGPAGAVQCLEDQECWSELQEGLAREMRGSSPQDVFSGCGDVDSPLAADEALARGRRCLRAVYAGYGLEQAPGGLLLYVFGGAESPESERAARNLSSSVARRGWRLYGFRVTAIEDRRRRSRER